MRNAGRLKSLVWWLFILASIALSVWSYYAFIEPRVEQITNIYQTTIAPLQGAGTGIQDILKNFNKTSSTTAQ